MPASRLVAGATLLELEEVLRSPGFAHNQRLSQFLRFVVEHHLEGLDFELKESVIGAAVFGRKADYDPRRDPIVRTEARRLRARLSQHYDGIGTNRAAWIELPKGGYKPVIHCAVEEAPISAPAPESSRAHWRLIALVCAGLTVVTLALAITQFRPIGRVRSGANSPAYDLYLRARAFEVKPNVSGVETSIDLFQRAIAKDPSFVPAYAGIAVGCAARSGFDQFDLKQRTDMIAKGWAAAETAIRLDARSADAQDALAMMQARQSQWALAEQSFQRAINLAPRDWLWRDHYAMFLLLPLGRVEDAIRELSAAEELDPLAPQAHSSLNQAFASEGRLEEAQSHCLKSAGNEQLQAGCWAEILWHQGRNEEALRILEEAWRGHLLEPGAHALGVAYAMAGRREDAAKIAAMRPQLASKAQIYAALRDKDRTFEVLDRMVAMGPARMGRDFLISPRFAFLKGDPRLKELRKKAGLPE